MANMNYWYDEQIKRYLLQFMRIFSNFQVSEGVRNGTEIFNRVPVRYADINRMVAHILKNNSENTINSTPMITCFIESLATSSERRQHPGHIDKLQVSERKYDQDTGTYGTEQGNLYSVERYMPVPYDLQMRVDIWTSNTDQKLQLLEQIMVLFNPSIQLQSNSNPLDWTNIFEVELENLQWSSRTQPVGTEETIDIASLTFNVPIWISPPAKVMRQKIINTIITNTYAVPSVFDLDYNTDIYDFFEGMDPDGLVVVTPNNYHLSIEGNSAIILEDNGAATGNWEDLLEIISPQGSEGTVATSNVTSLPLTEGSMIQLNLTSDVDNQDGYVTGFVTKDPNDTSRLEFILDADTLPSDTLAPVNRIVDPQANYPGDGVIPNESLGTRYLLTKDVLELVPKWGVQAKENDIIEYNGTEWVISFNSSEINQINYLTNSYTDTQYKWDGEEWISSYEGVYNPGFWRLHV